MKKTFLAMLLAGGSMTMFAQTTPTTQDPNTPTTNQPTTQQQVNGQNNMNNTNVTNDQNMNGYNSNINTWNGVQTNSTSWTPDRTPSNGWNSYGIWNNNNTNMNGTGNMNNTNTNMNNDGSMNSTGSYSAYGTAVPYLPANVQMRFNQDFPTNVNNQYTWNQYGDWYQTHYMNNGRLTQYYYDQRGNGYSLNLPVLMTFVPENIVTSALNKYGSNLYSISMVKTNDGSDAYMVGLIDRGQVSNHYLNESGVTVNDVWRTEDSTTLQSTQSNAAMGEGSSMHNNNTDMNRNQDKKSNWDAKKDEKKDHHNNDHK